MYDGLDKIKNLQEDKAGMRREVREKGKWDFLSDFSYGLKTYELMLTLIVMELHHEV